MRVTNSMIGGRVMFNMQRTLSRLLTMQSQMSSGRRIEKPSDDPIGTISDLNYRTALKQNEQFNKNINIANTRIGHYDLNLGELKDLIDDTKGQAILMANDNVGADERKLTAIKIKSNLDQILNLANSTLDGAYVFSGFRTATKPFESNANGVIYRGDFGKIDFPVDTNTKMTVNLNGSEVFLQSIKGISELADIDLGISGSTMLSDLNLGSGVDQTVGSFTITDNFTGITSTIDITAATDVNSLITTINNQLTADGITNLTAALGPDGNNLMLDINESIPLTISDTAPLSTLSDGYGINLGTGIIRVTDGAGVVEEIDLSTASTIGDIRTLFNNHMTAAGGALANVTMQINGAGNGLEITDNNGVPLGLYVEDINSDSDLAKDLGIVGQIAPTLTGSDLRPRHSFTVAENGGTSAADLGLVKTFFTDFSGKSLTPQITNTTLLADFNNRLGLDMNNIEIWQGETFRSFDLTDPALVTVQDMLDLFNNSGLDITVSIDQVNNGLQVVNNDLSRSLTIEDAGDGNLSKKLGIFGSTDLLGTMLVLAHSLEKNDRDGIELMEKNLDDITGNLLRHRSIIGSKGKRLETNLARITEQSLNYTKLLSEVEDADLSKLVVDLAMTENSYQASLISSAKIIQPSLMDFLR